jgi:hypothetical protein
MHRGSRFLSRTACSSVSITSVVPKWRTFTFIFSCGNRKVGLVVDDGQIDFGEHIPLWKRKCETVRCRDAAANSFVIKVRGEVFAHFHAVPVKRHSSVRNWLFGLPGRSEQSFWYQRKWWACSWLFSSSLSALDLMLFLCRMHREIASGQTHDSRWKGVRNQHVDPTAWHFVH